MAIRADYVNARSGQAEARLNRQDAEARQGRWLLELERSMLTSGAGNVSGGGPKRAAVGDRPCHTGATPAAAGKGGDPDYRSTNVVDGRHDGGKVRDTSRPAQRDSVLPAGSTQSVRAENLSSAAPWTCIQIAIAAAGDGSGLAIPAAIPGASRTVALAMPTPTAPMVDTADCSTPQFAEPDSFGEQQKGGATPSERQYGERTVFDKRLLSVFVSDEGVHAFIRDSTLGATSAQRVAQALTEAMSTAGQPTTGVTVNGKRIETIGARDSNDTSGDGNDEEPTAVFQHRFPVREGNPS